MRLRTGASVFRTLLVSTPPSVRRAGATAAVVEACVWGMGWRGGGVYREGVAEWL